MKKKFRNQHSKNCPAIQNRAMITNGKDHTSCLRSLDRFSCGIILCCVAATALLGCPHDYEYAGPKHICDSGTELPDTPEGHCEWEGKRCGGCSFQAYAYGWYYPCREVDTHMVVDDEKCEDENLSNPMRCKAAIYIAQEQDCKRYTEEACGTRGCKYELAEIE